MEDGTLGPVWALTLGNLRVAGWDLGSSVGHQAPPLTPPVSKHL